MRMRTDDYLVAYRSLIAEPKQGRGFSALWGILGADILTHVRPAHPQLTPPAARARQLASLR